MKIPPEKQQLIGVKTVKVAVMPLQKTIRTVGKVEYDEGRIATVNTKIEGWIEKLYVNWLRYTAPSCTPPSRSF